MYSNRPKVNLSKYFIELFDENNNKDEDHIHGQRKMLLFLQRSHIYTDIESSVFKEFCQKYKSGQKPKTNKELILFNIVKQNYYCNVQTKDVENFEETDRVFFVKHDEDRCKSIKDEKGVIVVSGLPFRGESYYLYNHLSQGSLDEQMTVLDSIKHPCTNLVFVDPYIFDSPFSVKLEKLIMFLKKMLPENLTTQFELDIITSLGNEKDEKKKESNEKKIIQNANTAKGKISKTFKNLSLNIYCRKYRPINESGIKHADSHKRQFITNYSFGTIDLPFTPDTTINNSFFPSPDPYNYGIEEYNNWKNSVLIAYKLITEAEKSGGYIISKSGAHHRIFKQFSECNS